MSRKRAGIAAVLAAASVAASVPALEVVNPSAAYPEGPAAVGGVVYYGEMGADRVIAWDGSRNRAVWERDQCGPTSVAPYSSGLLAILCHREEAVAIIDPATGETHRLIDRDDAGEPFPTPNASIADGAGGVYLSSSGIFSSSAPAAGSILHLTVDGVLRRLATGIHYANGVALSGDGRTLFVSEHLERRVLAFDVGADGALANRRVFVRLDDIEAADPKRGWEVGTDGLAVDPDGNLAIAEYGAGHVLIVGADAKLRATIPTPEQYVTAPTYIDGGKRIFITAPVSLFDPRAAGKVYVVENPLYRTN
jgi:gluconolactonase